MTPRPAPVQQIAEAFAQLGDKEKFDLMTRWPALYFGCARLTAQRQVTTIRLGEPRRRRWWQRPHPSAD